MQQDRSIKLVSLSEVDGGKRLEAKFEIVGVGEHFCSLLIDGRTKDECIAELMDAAGCYQEYKMSGYPGDIESWLESEINKVEKGDADSRN